MLGSLESTAVGAITGASETGVGAIATIAGECATDVGLEVLEDYGDESSGNAGKVIDYALKAKDVIDIGKSLL
ncbi:hypothetical protein AB0G64_29525 [Streptomyces longwoodensis]|uniref:hypothetical protein n=1 Tax=Streptomyces longwoodensis TaxID=68231 RepID=UPI00340D87FC